MEAASQRLLMARSRGERVLIHGDYDADGITATALLLRFFQVWGLEAQYFLPHRMEDGYGLSSQGIRAAREMGCTLMVTVDCGITGISQAAEAMALGMDVVITDHHLPGEQLPEALAIINPKQEDCPYPEQELCGAGLAFKLVSSLLEEPDWEPYLQLAALGTVADLVPLVGENRILVRHGLRAINRNPLPGILALAKVAGCRDEVDAERIAFSLAPRLNAAGRMDRADKAVELLIAQDPVVCQALAEELNLQNSQRQQVEEKIFALARDQAREQTEAGRRVLTLYSQEWHQGVVGIVASRIVESFLRPTFVLCGQGETLTGSARSIPGFNIYQALQGVAGLLQKYGGHVYAAGLSLARANLEHFAREVDAQAQAAGIDQLLAPILELDALLTPEQISTALVEEINQLRPFGMGNPEPKFAIHGLRLECFDLLGKNQNHLRLQLSAPGITIKGVGFGRTDLIHTIESGQDIQVAAAINLNSWQGRTELQLLLEDVVSPAARKQWQQLEVLDRRRSREAHLYLKTLRQQPQTFYIDLSLLPSDTSIIPDFFPEKVYNQAVGNFCILEPGWNQTQFRELVSGLPPGSTVTLLGPREGIPDLELVRLREFYRRWQSQPGILSLSQLAELYPGGNPGLGFMSLVLGIMEEAVLLTALPGGWQLTPNPQRVELSQLPSWQRAGVLIEGYRSWLEKYCQSPLDELLG
jgi:single-stranded-DNA-specific exonuclease